MAAKPCGRESNTPFPEQTSPMPWHAHLHIDYTLEQQRTVARFRHSGPLRILQSLYPEGDGICHNVLVHPPGGLVGGDTLEVNATVGPGAHALVTTPGATRFYRSAGEQALQRTRLALAPGAERKRMRGFSIQIFQLVI